MQPAPSVEDADQTLRTVARWRLKNPARVVFGGIRSEIWPYNWPAEDRFPFGRAINLLPVAENFSALMPVTTSAPDDGFEPVLRQLLRPGQHVRPLE